MDPMMELRSVWKAYPDKTERHADIVLRDLSLEVEENEFLCIVGPSGCGKTTILNLMAGFERPQRGKVIYRGKEVTGPSSERSVVFQEYSLLPWMNVQKNVAFSIDRKRFGDEERMERARTYLDIVGMGDYCNMRPSDLSGGMKQRVAIARTLAMEPDMLLMDEPFSALDEQTRGYLDGEIKRIWSEDNRTVVFITHNIDEAILLGTRIVMLAADAGGIIGEWRLDGTEDRDALRKAISGRLQRCNCTAGRPIMIKEE